MWGLDGFQRSWTFDKSSLSIGRVKSERAVMNVAIFCPGVYVLVVKNCNQLLSMNHADTFNLCLPPDSLQMVGLATGLC